MNKLLLSKLFILFSCFGLQAQQLADENANLPKDEVSTEQRNVIAASILGQMGVFRENKGQMREEIKYSCVTQNKTLFLLKDRIAFGEIEKISRGPKNQQEADDLLKNPNLRPHSIAPAPRIKYTTWTLRFVNPSPETWLTAEQPSESYTNFIYSSDNSKNASFVYDYQKVTYHDLYKSTDLVYYSHDKQLKYDFIVRPGGNPAAIAMQYDGIEKVFISHDGRLHIITPKGEQIEDRPVAYQEINGKRIMVPVSYKLIGNTGYGFSINGTYNHAYPLVIDPLYLDWSTYFGNVSSTDYIFTNGTSVDSMGFSYITGSAYNFQNSARTFPVTPGAYDTVADGYYDAFVTKMNTKGSALVFSTLIGGGGYDWGIDITTNKLNAVFITGVTYPVMAAPFPNTVNYTTVGSDYDIYAAQISAAGDRLIYSVMTGGAQWEYTTTITVSGSNELYVAGFTMSYDFYTSPTAYRKTLSGNSDMFIMRINAPGTFITYCSFLGGSSTSSSWWNYSEVPSEIEIGLGNQIFILGTTTTTDLPVTSNAYQSTLQGAEDMFLMKINPFTMPANQMAYCSYIGTSGKDYGMTFEMPKNNEFYIAGASTSSVFPGRINSYGGGTYDAVVLRFDINKPASQQLISSRYIGGNKEDVIRCMRMNRFGKLYITGGTKSSNFPVTANGYDTSYNGDFDCFLVKLNNTIDTLHLGSYFGGSGNDYSMYGVEYYYYNWFGRPSLGLSTADCIDKLTLGVPTNSNDFPTTYGAYQTTRTSTWSWMNTALVSFRDTLGNYAVIDLGPDTAFCKGFSYLVDAGNGGKNFKYRWNLSETDTFQTKTFTTAGVYYVDIFNICSFRRDSLVIKHKDPEVNIPDPPLICGDFNMTLTAGLPNPTPTTYAWSTGASTRQIGINTPGDYWVIATNICSSDTDTVVIKRKFNPIKPFSSNKMKDTTLCDGTSAQLDALEPDGKYKWYIGSSTVPADTVSKTFMVSQAGYYRVVVSNECGSAVDTINVITMNKPTLPLKNDTSLCNTVLFPVSAYNPNNKNPRYVWNNSGKDTLSFLIITEFKFYTLEVKNTCGSHYDSFWVWKDSTPVFSLGPDQKFCDAVNTTIDASFQGAKKYQWSNGDTVPVVQFTTPGNYSLDITNKCGTGRDTVKLWYVNLPKVNLGEDTLFCDVVNQFLDAGPDGEKYLWSTSASDTLPTLTIDQAGSYSVKVSNLCGDVFDTIFVDVSTMPKIFLGNDTIYCDGFSRNLDATFPYSTYLWSTGASTPAIDITTPGLYSVKVTNQCGETTEEIKIVQKFTPNVKLGNDTAYCGKMNRTLDASFPEATYIWNTGFPWDTLPVLKVNKEGYYEVKITNYCATVSEDINLVINPFPGLYLGRDTSLCEGVNLTLDGGSDGVSFLWQPSGNTSRYEDIKTYGTYVATVENQFGCVKTDTLRLMTLCPPRVFVPGAFTPNGFNNEKNEIFLPSYLYVDAAEITIYNRWGEKVFHSSDMTKGWDGTLNGMKCPDGLYFYQITAKGYNAEQNISGNVLLIR